MVRKMVSIMGWIFGKFPEEPVEVSVYECEEGALFGWSVAVSETGSTIEELASAAEQTISNNIPKMMWRRELLGYSVRVEEISYASRIDVRIILWNDSNYPPDRLMEDREKVNDGCHRIAMVLYKALRDIARTSVRNPSELEDLLALELQAILALEQLGEDVTLRKQQALDPDHPSRGRRRNKRAKWQGYKAQRGLAVDDASVSVLSERRRQNLQAGVNGNAPNAGGAAGP